ncbi:hypothetical protein LY76DRAFT_34157 [Colletotrichum caudatum]|nr:hypothetical protein LY76DRAFT_34157 [Colletotrichum caudatum]
MHPCIHTMYIHTLPPPPPPRGRSGKERRKLLVTTNGGSCAKLQPALAGPLGKSDRHDAPTPHPPSFPVANFFHSFILASFIIIVLICVYIFFFFVLRVCRLTVGQVETAEAKPNQPNPNQNPRGRCAVRRAVLGGNPP